MTTIAWDGKTLAADTLGNWSGMHVIAHKVKRCGSFVYAGCGARCELALIEDWLSVGAPSSHSIVFDEGGSMGLAYHEEKKRLFRVEGKRPVLFEVHEPFMADGSGRDFAMSAMAFGFAAEKAVAFACRFNLDSEQPIDAYDVVSGLIRDCGHVAFSCYR